MPDDSLLDIEPCEASAQDSAALPLVAERGLTIDVYQPPVTRPVRLGIGIVIVAIIGALVGGTWLAQYLPFASSVEANSLNTELVQRNNQLERLQTELEHQAAIIRTCQQTESATSELDARPEKLQKLLTGIGVQLQSDLNRVQSEWSTLGTQLRTDQEARTHELAWVHYQLAIGYMNQQRTQAAIEEIQKALRQTPQNALMWNQLGYCHLEEGDAERAIRAFEKYVQLSPEDPNSHDSLAEGYQHAGKLSMAEQEYRRALQLSPALGSAHYGLGQVYERMGHARLATNQYQRYIELCQGTSNEWVIRSRDRLDVLRLSAQ